MVPGLWRSMGVLTCALVAVIGRGTARGTNRVGNGGGALHHGDVSRPVSLRVPVGSVLKVEMRDFTQRAYLC